MECAYTKNWPSAADRMSLKRKTHEKKKLKIKIVSKSGGATTVCGGENLWNKPGVK